MIKMYAVYVILLLFEFSWGSAAFTFIHGVWGVVLVGFQMFLMFMWVCTRLIQS